MNLWIEIKSLIYRTGMTILRFLWHINGGRRMIVFGKSFLLVPETVFPSYRKLKLPKGGSHSEIVKYADYVQFHSIVNYVEQLKDQPVVVDIGAHHGAYAVVLGKIVERLGGKVLAVEPNLKSYRILSKNVLLNGLENTVVCESFAVSDENGVTYISALGSQSKITREPLEKSYSVKMITMEN